MTDERPIYEPDIQSEAPDPDEILIQDRRVRTQPYDLVVEALLEQIKGGTIFLRPLSERPSFQRRYVWTNVLASRLIESILLNVPIPPCYFSQNEDFELDVIDGQQRLYSIFRFLDNQYKLVGLEVLKDLNGKRFHQIAFKFQRQIKTHTLRCVIITNESNPEIKFDVFERLNTNTVPLNTQELRNCIYRGALNSYLADAAAYAPWLEILGRKKPDKRMRDEELILRFFAFYIHGIASYRTPQKHWLNEAAKKGQKYSKDKIAELDAAWKKAISVSLEWFDPSECYRREIKGRTRAINRALFDLVTITASHIKPANAPKIKKAFRQRYSSLLKNAEFNDLISRAVDHKKRTARRFELWRKFIGSVLP